MTDLGPFEARLRRLILEKIWSESTEGTDWFLALEAKAKERWEAAKTPWTWDECRPHIRENQIVTVACEQIAEQVFEKWLTTT